MAIEHSAGAIVFIKENDIKYLILYKKANPPYRESWDFPRGLIDEGEKEIEAVVREVKEETGIQYLKFVKDFREQIEVFYRKEGILVRKTITYYLAETNNDKVTVSSEHNDYAWLPIDDALARLRHRNAREILIKAHKILSS